VSLFRNPGLWMTSAGLVTGAALMYLPVHTQFELGDWERELRRTGIPAQGYVFDQTVSDRGSRTMYFRYQADGVTHEEEVDCDQVCLPAGATSELWYNPADPLDFVTDFGELSGERGLPQAVLGVIGLVLFGFTVFMTVTSDGRTRWFRRLIVLVDVDREFADGQAARRATSSAAAIALLESLRGRRIDELWLSPDLAGETTWPVVEWLQEQAYAGTRPDIGKIVLPYRKPEMARALREWAYEVSEGQATPTTPESLGPPHKTKHRHRGKRARN
jgi:hypothetical protein